jgi:hypothetical protein
VISPENGFLASVACASYRTLNASTAAPEPHDFTVRFLRVRLAHSASIASHRAFVTIAKRPSSAGDRWSHAADLGENESGMFFDSGIDAISENPK